MYVFTILKSTTTRIYVRRTPIIMRVGYISLENYHASLDGMSIGIFLGDIMLIKRFIGEMSQEKLILLCG